MKGFLKGCCLAALAVFVIGVGMAIFGTVMGGAPVGINIGPRGLEFKNFRFLPFNHSWDLLDIVDFDDDNGSTIYIGDDNDEYKNKDNNNINKKDNNNTNTTNNNNFQSNTNSAPEVIAQPTINSGTAATESDIRNLDFEFGAAEVRLVPGDKFNFESTGHLLYETKIESDGTWSIEVVSRLINFVHEKVTVTYPRDMKFNKVDIEIGAGTIYIDGINTTELDFTVGAGSFEAENIVCTGKASLQADASAMTVSGKFDGYTSLESGAGTITLKVDEKPTTYGYKMDVGMGKVKVFENKFAGIASERIENRGTLPFYDIEVGAGQIIIE